MSLEIVAIHQECLRGRDDYCRIGTAHLQAVKFSQVFLNTEVLSRLHYLQDHALAHFIKSSILGSQ